MKVAEGESIAKSLEKVNGQKIISAIKKPENIKLNNVIDL